MSFAPTRLRRRHFLARAAITATITATATATAAVSGIAAIARAATPTPTPTPSGAKLKSMVPTLSKAAVGYIDIPHGGEVCGACIWFKPPSPGSTTSHCHLVAGPISAAGWCQAWMQRSAAA